MKVFFVKDISKIQIDEEIFFLGWMKVGQIQGLNKLRKFNVMDKIMLSLFLKILKSRKDKDEKTLEAISIIENGFNGVSEENLEPVIEWLNGK